MRRPRDGVVSEAKKIEINIDTGVKVRRKASLVVTYIKETPKTASIIKVEGIPQNWYYAQVDPPKDAPIVKTVAKEFRKATHYQAMYLAEHFLIDSAII